MTNLLTLLSASYGASVHFSWDVVRFTFPKIPDPKFVQVTCILWVNRGIDVGVVPYPPKAVYGRLESGLFGPLPFNYVGGGCNGGGSDGSA
ncbi:uncharacterized protein J3R85_000358 [Psidium guajava]|nr:uncharacterized protein J3R85_000358 [Psidium guajava]